MVGWLEGDESCLPQHRSYVVAEEEVIPPAQHEGVVHSLRAPSLIGSNLPDNPGYNQLSGLLYCQECVSAFRVGSTGKMATVFCAPEVIVSKWPSA